MESSAPSNLNNGPGTPWYALHVRPRYEKIVSYALRQKGITEFLPLYQQKRRWSDRVTNSEWPLFPGYVFAQLDWSCRLVPVLTTPGVLRVVGIGKMPVPVETAEIEAIRLITRSGLLPRPWPLPRVGDRVYLEDGPLRGLEGLLVRSKTEARFVVSVMLLQRAVAVEIDGEWARPVKPSRIAPRGPKVATSMAADSRLLPNTGAA